MRYLSPDCRSKERFIECAKIQMRDHWRWDGPVHYNSEVAITANHDYEKYKGKMLVVGGGPTTNEVNWNPFDYDCILSCNHFFLNEKLKNCVDFAVLCPEVDIFRMKFQEFQDDSPETVFCIENVDFQREKIDCLLARECVALTSVRVNLQLTGTAGRLLIIASNFQPASIDVVGLDGVPPGGSKRGDHVHHSFQPNKTFHRDMNYEAYVEELRWLWNYLKTDIGKNIKYRNLGHGHPHNISTQFNIL